jgi:hypothetical protein
MFMDDINNDYFYPMGGTSVVLEKPKREVTSGKEGTAVVAAHMRQFIDALRVKRPTWRFKSTERIYSTAGQKLCNFDVYYGDEQLGRVWTETHWRTGEARYCLNNHRLEKSRQRGHGSFSTKVSDAVKKVLGSFGVKSLDERAAEAQKEMAAVVYHIAAGDSYKFETGRKQALDALSGYIIDNWEQLRGHAGAHGTADLPEMRTARRDSNAALTAFNNNGGTMLATHGDQFLKWRRDTAAETSLVGVDALTDKQRAGLGILKLVDEKTLIPGIGVRVAADKFFLLD